MSFVWDEEKERRNVAKHKIPFAEAVTVFDDPLFVIAADDDHSLARNGLLSWESQRAEDYLLLATLNAIKPRE